jgi:hypothetical protein
MTIWVPTGRGPPPLSAEIVASAARSPLSRMRRSGGRASSANPNNGQELKMFAMQPESNLQLTPSIPVP